MAGNQGAMSGAAQGAAAGTAIMPGWGTAIGGAIGLAGGLAADQAASSAEDEARKKQQAYIAALQAIPVSTMDDLSYKLQTAQYAGDLTPEQERLIQLQGKSALETVQVDPRLKNAQMNNLALLQKLGQSGLSPEQAAELSSVQRSVEADQQARIKSMLEQQQARGMASSDAALTARMIDTQSGANRQAEQAQNTAAMAYRNALAAMSGAGSLAGQMGQQEYSQEAAKANAADTRQQYNVGLEAGQEQRRVAAGNAANEFNLRNKQQLNYSNADVANEMARRKAQATETIRNQRLAQVTGTYAPTNTLSDMDINRGNRQARQYTGAASAIGEAMPAIINAFSSKKETPSTQNSFVPSQGTYKTPPQE